MTDAQLRAALEVMKGTFKTENVQEALMRANLPISELKATAEGILQREEEAGHIRRINTDTDEWVKI